MKMFHSMFHSARGFFSPPEINSAAVYELTFLAATFT